MALLMDTGIASADSFFGPIDVNFHFSVVRYEFINNCSTMFHYRSSVQVFLSWQGRRSG